MELFFLGDFMLGRHMYPVLKRVIDAGKKYRCNIIARVTSDCPLIDIKIIDKAILMFKKKKCDFLSCEGDQLDPTDI